MKPYAAKCVIILSGGMDSTILLHRLAQGGHEIHALMFDYGQRHRKELAYAKQSCHDLEVSWDIVDLSDLTHLISNSALTSPRESYNDQLNRASTTGDTRFGADVRKIEVPEGHYAEDNMALTVVPNRNMIMLSIAAGVAVNDKAAFIATGVHAGDHAVYPDCREQFVNAASMTVQLATEGFNSFTGAPIYTPYIQWSKADIAYEGIQLGVDFSKTWSCYKGGDYHCGRCGTCVERLEAINEAGVRYVDQKGYNRTNDVVKGFDTTEYADTEFWKFETEKYKGANK